MKLSDKARYLVWAASRWPGADRSCPACRSRNTRLIKRKYGVTGLFECEHCHLFFRMPKGSLEDDGQFYEEEYEQGSTTDLPNDEQLRMLKASSFREIGKDYTPYIDVLRALGLNSGASIYDYGSSWGYGSWQFRKAGYRVYSYDVAKRRARFAQEKLGCTTVAGPTRVPEGVDCVFASHVIEHLADPNVMWTIAVQVLKPRGVLVLLTPNGEPRRGQLDARTYHQLWGRVHPLLLSVTPLTWMAEHHGFEGAGYSSPYELSRIAQWLSGRLDGDELLFVARRKRV
ncbi:MAG: methyltransferase domain-containing protein [Chloroflexi bacterium]|nr:methyltransferase domain-containing protein [Chloroflexota bacterium]